MPAPRRWLRRHLLPAAVIAAIVSARLLILAMERYDFWLDQHFNAMMGFQFLVMVGLLVLGVWFLFLSGYPRWVKAAKVGLGVGAIAALAVAVQSVEMDGHMTPHFRGRWEPSDAELLAKQRAESGGPVGGANLALRPTDSGRFRGPAGDGTAPGVALADDWSADPPKVVWKKHVGTGHAGLAAAGNSVVTVEQDGDNEAVVCYDRATGDERWRHGYPAKFSQTAPMGGDGPRTTPTVVDGRVYSLGAAGDLVCLDGATGAPKWHVNVLTDNGAANLQWGLSGSPLVVGDRVIVNPGIDPKANANQAVAAYDRVTGKKLWATGSHGAAYASPQPATLGGFEQVLIFDADGLGGYDPASGAELWRHPWVTAMGMNSAQPVVVGPDRVLISSEVGNGAAVVEVRKGADGWSAAEVWRSRKLHARFATPVVHGGHIYGLSGSSVVCLDAATGKLLWQDGAVKDGQILLAGDRLVISDGEGAVLLVAADPSEYHELGRVKVFDHRTWNMPALAGRELFLRSHRQLACVELPGR